MTRKGPLDCRFFLNGCMLAEVALHTAPHVGDLMMMRDPPLNGIESPDRKLKPYKVIERVFFPVGAQHNRQLVLLYVETLGSTQVGGV